MSLSEFNSHVKAVVSVSPDNHVFRGETVTLRCDIQGEGDTGWTYSWYKNNYSLYPHTTYNPYMISSVTQYYSGTYTCRRYRGRDSQSSEISNAVTLTVSVRPQALLSVSPQSWLTEGVSVSLSCEVRDSSTGWTFSWYRAVPYRECLTPVTDIHGIHVRADLYKDGSLIQTQTAAEITIHTVSKSDEGVYYCKHPERGDSPHSWVSVRDLPTTTLTVEPQSPVFTGESVTLKCEVQGYDGWTYQWYKKKAQSQWTTVSQSVFDTVNRDTLTISGDAVVNGDQYQCRGERHDRPTTSQYSNTVNLTVHAVKPKPGLTSNLKGAAPVGNPVTLYCKLEQSAGWSFYWSRHTHNPENETNTAINSYTISSVAPSYGGQYWCRAALSHSEAPFSILSLLSSLLAVSPYLLVSIVLGVKGYKTHALTETRSQNAVSEE
ncbi:hypothetical protein P4O66_004122 [Electrophorus voltai]|uniref:Ig-like domain-containing protein n=1 Tax=Electrophorus voltai TaxID=2609070 RepID=A0AAD9E3R0_9TELE|nr:hypothetical protein P4O66_004122 [Electrophorus voltai]